VTGSNVVESRPVAVIVGVDVGGSGLRLQCGYAGGPGPGPGPGPAPGPVLSAPGVRVGAGGIDVAALARDARGLLEGAGVAAPDVVVWGMRGLLFLADRHEVLRLVRDALGAARTVVASDAVTNLIGAVGGLRPGAVVAAGTGAVAFGSDFAGHWNRVDGWGHVLGDWGSAARLGLEGLAAGLRHRDGLPGGSATLLTAGEERFGPVDGWPRLVMTSPDAPHLLASFAPVVTAASGGNGSGAGDAVASGLCANAGVALADSLLAAATGLPGPSLVATGGLVGAEPVDAALRARLAEQGRALSPALGGSLDGALLLARHLAEVGAVPEHPAYLLCG
jgi:N-acetylglucosamine kinase-like BadF-type ATPase